MVININDRVEPIPEELLRQAQLGDRQSREVLLSKFQPYVVRVASGYCGRFLHNGVDEEISIALLALDEAINSYKPDQGSSFASFVRVVVRRRLIDYFRRHKSYRKEVPFSNFQDDESEEGSTLNLLERDEAEKVYLKQQEVMDRKDEIVYYSRLLAQYNISLAELVSFSPKHASARKRAVEAAQMITEDEELLQYFLRLKELPLKQLEGRLTFSRKTLERQRKFIIALVLVYIEDLPHIREYLKGDNEE